MTDLDERCDKPLKVFFHPVDAVGHINSCIGLAQTMQNRGHTIYFLSNQSFKGKYSKYGFTELLLKDYRQLAAEKEAPKVMSDGPEQPPVNPIKFIAAQLMESGMLSNKSPLERMKEMKESNTNLEFINDLCNKSIAYNDQIKEAIEREKPDLVVVDSFFVEPSIMHSGLPWIMLSSACPLFLYESDQLPPSTSGLSINDDRAKWEEFKKVSTNQIKTIINGKQNEMLRHFNYPEIESSAQFTMSPYLNIYGYPEELDYHDVVPRPEKILGVDAFCRKMPQPFEFPVEFKNKIKPGDKLVYVSLGSMGSFNIELMKRLVEVLGKTPHKYVVSKGPLHDEFELADNMWGEEYVPQTSILPLMDLVITHGGNNSVTETFSFGKPMIVMPLFADQCDNAQRIQDKGFGVRMNAHEYAEQELVETVNRLLSDTELKQRLAKISERIQQSKSKEKACIKIEKFVEEFPAKQ